MCQDKISIIQYTILVAINFLYACVGIFSKLASQQDFLSWGYLLSFGGAVGVIGVYAILWQQVIKRIELSTAYMFKGTTIIFTMLFAYWLFGEQITWNNILGAVIIIIGIVLFAYTPSPLTSNQSSLT